MATLTTNADLLIGQWQDSPRLRGAVEAVLDLAKQDVFPALARARAMLDVETAEGVWLDLLGRRVGIERPALADPVRDPRFGFDDAGVGFDQRPYAGDAANEAVFPLSDATFRLFVKAAGISRFSAADGSIANFSRAVRLIDPAAAVQDRRDMTVRVVTSRRTLIEIADSIGALPRVAGVGIVYADRGRFGFDDAGVGFDQGPYS